MWGKVGSNGTIGGRNHQYTIEEVFGALEDHPPEVAWDYVEEWVSDGFISEKKYEDVKPVRKRTELDELLETNGVKALFWHELEEALEDEQEQLQEHEEEGGCSDFEFYTRSWYKKMAYQALRLLRNIAEDLKELENEGKN